jgi:hypothetical protein
MFHTTPFQSQTAWDFIHTSVESNRSHIPHHLKIAKESNYLADKRPVFPSNSKEDTAAFAS